MNRILFQQLAMLFDGAVFLTARHTDDDIAVLAITKASFTAFKTIGPIKKWLPIFKLVFAIFKIFAIFKTKEGELMLAFWDIK
ncbi:hypothetical protein [Enterovibrio sp. 27052020O]|uniref:hypothetical protein n=1 Tax=Enterovibrio sp. 27052020O TaxID=3241166 RepID=UPI003890B4B4